MTDIILDIDSKHDSTFLSIGQVLWLTFLVDYPERKAVAFVVSHHTPIIISYGDVAERHSTTPELIDLQHILSSTPMYITYAIFVTRDMQITAYRHTDLIDIIWKRDDLSIGESWDIIAKSYVKYLKSKNLLEIDYYED